MFRNRPFLIFILVVGLWIVGAVLLIQTPQFAQLLKVGIARFIPKDMGVQSDFSNLTIQFFPPSLSVQKPTFRFSEHNIANIPAGTSIEAERMDFKFRPFQVLSGEIRVHSVSIFKGKVSLTLNEDFHKPKKKTAIPKLGIHWDELLRIRAEAVELHEIGFDVRFVQSPDVLQGSVDFFRLAQRSERGGLGYSLDLKLHQIQGSLLEKFSLPPSIQTLSCDAFVNALGLKLDALSVAAPGFEIMGHGRVLGNPLEREKLLADLQFTGKGQLAEVLKAFPSQSVRGVFQANAHVEGDLLKPMETLRVSSALAFQNVHYRDWNIDSAHLEGQWLASLNGGEIALAKAVLSSQELPRLGAFQPGSGGKIALGPLRWTLGSPSPIRIPLHLERAHIHWLAPIGVKSIYPLDFRLSGDLNALFTPPTPTQRWSLAGDLKATVDQFVLDNQKYKVVKKTTSIFKVPRITIEGGVDMNSTGILLDEVMLRLPHTQLEANGRIDFKKGLDFTAKGPVQLADLGEIAENKVQGTGSVDVLVHGPFSTVIVDVDVDAKDAQYLGLDLGKFKGKITWDDDPSHLLFHNVHLSKNSLEYTADGKFDLGPKDAADLKIHISKGSVQDLTTVLKSLLDKVSWFPQSIRGSIRGDIDLKGGVSLSKLKVLGNLRATNLDLWGERFQSADIEGGYDSGDYFISKALVQKRFGKLSGKISYDTHQHLEWEFATLGLMLSDFDRIAQLDVPIRGNMEIQSTGGIKQGVPYSSTSMDLSDLRVRGVSFGPSQLTLKTQHGKALLNASILGGQGVVDSSYDFNSKEESTFHSEFNKFDFSPFLLLINPSSLQDRSLAGSFSGQLKLRFHSGEIERGTGTASLTSYRLARNGSQFILAQPISFKVNEGDFRIENFRLLGGSGEVALDLEGHQGRLEGALTGDLDLAILQFFTPVVSQTTGSAALDFSIGGTLKQPTLSGKAKLDGDFIRLASLESPLENISGVLQLKQNRLELENIRGNLGGGKVSAEGEISLFSDRYPGINLKGNFTNSRLKIYPFQSIQFSGPISVTGDAPPYLVKGAINVESAYCRERILTRKSTGAGLKVVQYSPQQAQQSEGGSSSFKLNIDVDAPKGIFVENELFKNLQAKAKLNLINTLDAPRVLGTAEIIQGQVLFKDHAFQIQSGTALFDSPTLINPRFDLNGVSEIRDVKVFMNVSGRVDKMDKIKVELSSSPAMQETEILSLLATGFTPADAKKLSANDLSVVQQGEAASLVLHSLGLSRDIEDKTGFQVQLDETVNSQQGVSAFRTQVQADASAAPQITIRRKLNERLSLSAGSTVGVGTNKSYQLNLDYSVNRSLSLTGVFNNYGTYGGADAQRINVNSMGVDLKFQRRFK